MRKGEAKLKAWMNDWIQTNTPTASSRAIHKKYHGVSEGLPC